MDGVPSARFRLSLLGRFELTGPHGIVELPSKKLAGLLTYLACTSPRPQRRETLSSLLWGTHFEVQAKQNLRQALFRLRKVLGPDALAGDGEIVALNTAAVHCDVNRFAALLRDGSRDALSAAADLYRGPLVDDVVINDEGWSEWLTGERVKLLDLALGALLRLGEQELAVGRAEQALKAGRRAIGLDGMREDAHRLVIQALATAGRKAEALKHYQDLVVLLKGELNTQPDAATTSLVAELRSTQGPSATPTVAKPAPSDRASKKAPPFVDEGAEQKADVESPARRSETASAAVLARTASPERRQLTIMACSVVGPLLSPSLDPEDARDLIVTFHKAVADVAARFDGFVAQDQGDCLLVYFGYPTAHEHDAEQAVRAGLALMDLVGTLKAEVPLRARVGIATGLVVVGEQVMTGGARQHVAVGEAPSLAAQLQAVAAPGELVIAAGTRRLVGRMFDCRALGADELRGLPSSAQVWQVRGETAGVSRFEARRTGALTPLVGRQEEIELLLRRWDQAKGGEGRVVMLSGEPGIGKSRIAENLLEKLEGEPHTRARYFCSPHHTHSPLYPLITYLERLASFEPGSSASAKLDRLEALLKPMARNVPQDLALIADLLSVPTEGRYPALLANPQRKRELTLTALLDQLEGVAADSPILIVFEDVHWIDPTSLDLLDRMVSRVTDIPLLLIVTFRSEFQPTWVDQPHVTMLPLSRLGRRDSAGIADGIAKGKKLPDAVLEQVLAHTDGVPLFIEELTSTLIESGLMRDAADHYVLDGPLPPLAIPTTLQASLGARLDRLGAVKDVAQIGAAIGRAFSHELIAALTSFTPEDLDVALERLTASGLISRRGAPPIATYVFKHALVQDAAYASLLKSRRLQLHASIGKVLVERFSELAERLPEMVAHHFAEGGFATEAIGYWLKAGRLAYARSANREAVSFFEQALHVLDALSENPSMLEQAFETRLELRQVLYQLGEGRQMLERLREAAALAERLNDDGRRGRVGALMTTVHSLFGELDEALASGTRALTIAARLSNLQLRIVATTYLEQTHYFRGEHERVVALATDNLAALPPDRVSDYFGVATPPSIHDRCFLMMSLAELGRFGEAAEPEAEAIRLAVLTQHAPTVGVAHFFAGTLHLLRGDWVKARTLVEHAIAVFRTGNVVAVLPYAVALSAWVLAQHDEGSEAANRLREGEQLLDRYATMGFVGHLGWFYQALARACLLLGRRDEARRLGIRAIEFSPSQPGFAARALHLLGDVASHPDRFDAEGGEARYRQALALAEPRGMRPLVAHCRFGLGKLYHRTGMRDQACDQLAAAATMYHEMDMRFWLDQVEAERRQLR
jgi:class 3 adenylate cyclase/DNA-binding SARP family transcriptional activator